MIWGGEGFSCWQKVVDFYIAIGEDDDFFDEELNQFLSFFKGKEIQAICQEMVEVVDACDDFFPPEGVLLLKLELLSLFL